MNKTILIIACVALVALAACQKKVEYPIEPHINYEGFTYLLNEDGSFSGTGIVAFSYSDGDGDLGLDETDDMPPFGVNDPYYYNMWVDYMKLVDGQFVKTPLLSPHVPTTPDDTIVLYDTVSFNARFHRLRDNDDPKAISGLMEYTMPVQNPLSPNDTIKFEIRIFDRALHESNVIQTEPIFTNPMLNK